MSIQMQSMRNEQGRWEVAFRHTTGPLADRGWAFEPESPTFATKAECERQREQWQRDENADRAAQQRYAYQIEYACGVRD